MDVDTPTVTPITRVVLDSIPLDDGGRLVITVQYGGGQPARLGAAIPGVGEILNIQIRPLLATLGLTVAHHRLASWVDTRGLIEVIGKFPSFNDPDEDSRD